MAEAAEIANLGREPGQGRVQHVPINERFQGHRFCEEGVTEPNYNNPQSWFLLHASTDHVPPGALLPDPDPMPSPFEGPREITEALCADILSRDNVTAGIEFGQYMACTVAATLANGERLADHLNTTVPPGFLYPKFFLLHHLCSVPFPFFFFFFFFFFCLFISFLFFFFFLFLSSFF
jgi:hypothetical protein